MSKTILEMDVGQQHPRLTLVYDDQRHRFKKGPNYDNTPHNGVQDLRAYRKNEDSPCLVIKSVSDSKIDPDFRVYALFPLILAPAPGSRQNNYKYETAEFSFALEDNPYATGVSVQLHNWQLGVNAAVGQTGDEGVSLDQLSSDFPGPAYGSFRVVIDEHAPPLKFITKTVLEGVFESMNDAHLTHTANSTIEDGHGLDVIARSLATDRANFIAMGFGLGVKTARQPSATTAPRAVFRMGGNSVELPLDGQVRVRVFQSPMLMDSKADDHTADWMVEVTGLSAKAFVRFWNERIADPHLAALATIDAARSLSFMPRFDESTITGDGRFALLWKVRQSDTTTTELENKATFFGAYPVANSGSHSSFQATAIFPQIRGRDDGLPFTRPVRITFASNPIEGRHGIYEDLNLGRAQRFRIAIGPQAVKKKPRKGDPSQRNLALASKMVRVGALDLELKPDGEIQGAIGVALDALAAPLAGRVPHVDINFDKLGLGSIAPGGEDPVPDDLLARNVLSNDERGGRSPDMVDALLRAAPIVASCNQITLSGSRLLLEVQENTDIAHSRNLILRLRSINLNQAKLPASGAGNPPPPPQLRAIVIDPEPFLVAALEVPVVIDQSALDQTDGEFAIYRTSEIESQGWSIARIPDGFDLFLPPQGIGEAMEKGAPWPPISDEVTGNPKTIDYRFSPTARLWLADREVVGRYGEAPWNLRRRFGNPGDRVPGSELAGLRAELLYGLAMQLSGDFLRVTELGARIGAIRGNLPAIESSSDETPQAAARRQVYTAFRQLWAYVGKSYRTRLALLEPWREGTVGPLVADSGVDFLLRVSGELLRGSGGTPADLRDPFALDPKAPGLAGGATWGFESPNVYKETVGKPRSTGGRIVAPGLSALGGFGKLKAEFANGKTCIAADVSLGRTHRYVVERLGRIGLVWNRAKHVIVYERTVLPSEQFSGPGWPLHQGRPVLRKVEEYVELLQPKRSFVEKDSPPIRSAMAAASVFPVVKIPVDGRNWGRDVPDGWIVPLWRADANQRIYPKPRILMRMVATEDAAEPTFDATATNPERLVFFTSTRPQDGADTDAWAPVNGFDFINAARPATTGDAASPTANLDSQQPDDLIEDPAFAAVTIPIDAGGRRANLGAGRVAEGGFGAVLESLTFMRAAPAKIDDVKQQIGQAATRVRSCIDLIRGSLADLPSALEQIVGGMIGSTKVKIIDAINAEAQRATDQINSLEVQAQGQIAYLTSIKANWISAGSAVRTAEAGLVKSAIGAITSEATEATNSARDDGLAALTNWDTDRQRVQSEIKRSFTAVQSTTRSAWPALANAYRLGDSKAGDCLANLKTAIDATIDKETARLEGLIGSLLQNASGAADRALGFVSDVTRVGNSIIDQGNSVLARVPKMASNAGGAGKLLTALRVDLDNRADTTRKAIENAAGDLVKLKLALDALIDGTPIVTGNPVIIIIPISLATLLKARIGLVIDHANQTLSDALLNAETNLGPVVEDLNALKYFDDKVAGEIGTLFASIDAAVKKDDAAKAINNGAKALTDYVNGIAKIGEGAIQSIAAQFCEIVTDIVAPNADVNAVIDQLTKQIPLLTIAATQAIEAARVWAIKLVDRLAGDADAMVAAIESRVAGFASDALGMADDLKSGLDQNVGRLADAPTYQNPESTLNLIRAAGQSPLVPNFRFNRDRIAYIFDDFQEAIQTSPMVGLVNRVGEDLTALRALGLRVPTRWLSDHIVPLDLPTFDISKIFPDLSGFKLDGLFSGIKLPQIAQDNIKVTHGFDRASQAAWVKATSDIPLDHSVDILSFGPMQLSILSGRFDAQVDVIATVQGPPRASEKAEIVGDWQLAFGGLRLVTFESTRIAYDNSSGLTIDISPDRIRFDQAIQFLSDMIESLGDPDSGFVLELERDDDGRPIGVRAGLDLPLPPIAAGAFAASGIRLAASTALRVVKGEFSIETAAALGRPDEPFTLMIAFFNGGGYLSAHCLYYPQRKSNNLTAYVSIEIVAGVGADFSFGVARGSVYLQIGAEATFITSGGGGGVTIEVFLLLRGGVTILSLITIALVMRLGIVYNSADGSVDANGSLSVSIKISVFFTKHVDVPIHYHLAGNSSHSRRLRANEAHYLDLFA